MKEVSNIEHHIEVCPYCYEGREVARPITLQNESENGITTTTREHCNVCHKDYTCQTKAVARYTTYTDKIMEFRKQIAAERKDEKIRQVLERRGW